MYVHKPAVSSTQQTVVLVKMESLIHGVSNSIYFSWRCDTTDCELPTSNMFYFIAVKKNARVVNNG